MVDLKIISANTILYCREWEKTVDFYRDGLSLKINFRTDWFVEFLLSDNSRISIADQAKSSIKVSTPHGITIALEVDDIESVWKTFIKKELRPTQIKDHPWAARVFYLYDPEGRRIEIWQTQAT
ncbi:VOC family protein [Desulfospira joergensenii]|uniref:VOC family protein n=1 Tax=Desulfospira joergensenii TaxID=53329 RepID=UPI0003B49B88|nr:VOC family protein [Desulfospira joergensenii]